MSRKHSPLQKLCFQACQYHSQSPKTQLYEIMLGTSLSSDIFDKKLTETSYQKIVSYCNRTIGRKKSFHFTIYTKGRKKLYCNRDKSQTQAMEESDVNTYVLTSSKQKPMDINIRFYSPTIISQSLFPSCLHYDDIIDRHTDSYMVSNMFYINCSRIHNEITGQNYQQISLIPLRKTKVPNKKVATAMEDWIQKFQRLLYPLNFEYQISKD